MAFAMCNPSDSSKRDDLITILPAYADKTVLKIFSMVAVLAAWHLVCMHNRAWGWLVLSVLAIGLSFFWMQRQRADRRFEAIWVTEDHLISIKPHGQSFRLIELDLNRSRVFDDAIGLVFYRHAFWKTSVLFHRAALSEVVFYRLRYAVSVQRMM
jgi:hypothetical protein